MAASPAQVTLPVFTQRKILISLCQLQARIAFPPTQPHLQHSTEIGFEHLFIQEYHRQFGRLNDK